MSAPPQPRIEVVDRQGNAILLRVHTTNGYLPTWRHFLVGQDSNNMAQPFVTQVFRKLQTVEEAFDSLMPKAVKEARAKGLEVKRQGDWFFVPCGPPQGPSCNMQQSVESPYRQPKQTLDPHILYDSYDDATRHLVLDMGSEALGNFTKGEIVYRASGHHLVRGIVSAPDHENLYLKDWHAAYRANSGPWGRNGRQVGGD